jgi:hypothetical protein
MRRLAGKCASAAIKLDALPAIQLADVENVEIALRVVELADDARCSIGVAPETGAVRHHADRRVLGEVLVEQPVRALGGADQTVGMVVDLGLETFARLDLGAHRGICERAPALADGWPGRQRQLVDLKGGLHPLRDGRATVRRVNRPVAAHEDRRAAPVRRKNAAG